MQESYYDRLGIEKTADAMVIKRAYYTKVKQFPPERFPEEYKELRAAYETLSSVEKREEYDKGLSLPPEAASLMGQAGMLQRTGRLAEASDVYELVLKMHPGLTLAMEELALSYLKQGKNGKAVTVWERAYKNEPDNPEYSFNLALSYENRSWNKKAENQYWHTLAMDDSNANYWLGLLTMYLHDDKHLEAEHVCQQALKAMEKHGKENVSLSVYAFMFCTGHNFKGADQHLEVIARLLPGCNESDRKDAIEFLLTTATRFQKAEYISKIKEMAATLPRIDEDLRQKLDDANTISDIESLLDKGYSPLFHDLFGTLYEDCNCEECRYELLAMELHLLTSINNYRQELLRLKKEFPHLYEMHAKFFNEALRSKNIRQMLAQRVNLMEKMDVSFLDDDEDWDDEDWDETGWADDEDEEAPAQTVRNEEPKIGRNDPCPCGSGKKYKKCCGLQAGS